MVEQVNIDIKNYKLLNYTLEVLALIGLISLNQSKFDALMSKVLVKRNVNQELDLLVQAE